MPRERNNKTKPGDAPVIKVFAALSLNGCKVEDQEPLPDNWHEMTEKEQNRYLDEVAQDFLANHVDCGAYVE